ncbi:hypothetical protein BB734_20960 [Mycobacterium avium subsp. hominissuis]|uniref:Uncharacterized protein n=2 Tax=Mycobacterium avium complex (MAC) TaxID=120793 RepID=A0A2A3LB53_MYCAV|nr:hypothetical protein BS641_09555 [Mycobacterium avium subsp. hominissuis]ARV85131.1 hypothetical protein BWK49_16115 [Mycobacterium intracellulare subsp. chimaera]ASW98209.1 hypothetical protein CKJ67_14265 [Mycobacterium intracellulare]MBG0729623.1 hypothetical protein [Mycobacterium avium]RAV10771.1 hypothetical protein DQP57_12850 [Mycobacterium colombiense]
MTETPQAPSESTAGKPSPRSSRLGQVAAVVGITAGVVFVVGAVFFSGLFLGSRWEHHSGPQMMRCEMGGSGGGMGGMMGPGGMGPMMPGQPPSSTSTTPSVPVTPRP